MKDKHYWHTIEAKIKGCKIKASQKMIVSVDLGHYKAYIEDENRNVISTISSTGAPKEKLTIKDLEDFFKRCKQD